MAGRALKMLGMSPAEEIANTLSGMIKGWVKQVQQKDNHDAQMSLDLISYCSFWDACNTSAVAGTRALRELVQGLQAIRSSAKSLTKRGIDIEQPIREIVNTIWFICMFMQYDAAKMSRVWGAWSKTMAKSHISLEHFVYKFVAADPGQQPLLPLVVRIASPLVGHHAVITFEPLLTAKVPRRTLFANLDTPFQWTYLQAAIAEGSTTHLIFNSLASLLSRVPSTLRRNKDVTISTVASALIMLRECVVQHAIPDPEFLLAALPAVRRIESWPRPLADLAADVAELLLMEAVSPGSGLVSTTCQMNPLLTADGEALLEANPNVAHAWAAASGAALVFYDEDDPAADLYLRAIGEDSTPYTESVGRLHDPELGGDGNLAVRSMPAEEVEQANAVLLDLRFKLARVCLELDFDPDDLATSVAALPPQVIAGLWPKLRSITAEIHNRRAPKELSKGFDGGDAARTGAAGESGDEGAGGGDTGGEEGQEGEGKLDTYAVHLERFLAKRSLLVEAGVKYTEDSLGHSNWFSDLGSVAGLVADGSPFGLKAAFTLPDRALHFVKVEKPSIGARLREVTRFKKNDMNANRVSANIGALLKQDCRRVPRMAAVLRQHAFGARIRMMKAFGSSRTVLDETPASPAAAAVDAPASGAGAGVGAGASAATTPGGDAVSTADVTLTVDVPPVKEDVVAATPTKASPTKASTTPKSAITPNAGSTPKSEAAAGVDDELTYPPGSMAYYAPTTVVHAITNLAADASAAMVAGYDTKPVLKLVAMGPDRTWHSLLSGVIALWRERPLLMQKLDVCLYVIPTPGTHNNMAMHLARTDPWYRRQVYSAFNHLPIAPKIKLGPEKTDKSRVLSPLSLLRNLANDYLRSATQRVALNIFDCECWRDPKHLDTAPNVVIPFCARVEIGINANVAAFQKEAPSDSPWVDVLGNKTFLNAYGSSTCNVKLRMQAIEHGNAPQERGSSQYSSIVASTIASPEDGHDAIAGPEDPWLQLALIKSKGPLQTLLSRKDRGKDLHSLEDAANSTKEVLSTSTILITAASAKEKFRIMVDGAIFGPFSQVRLGKTRCVSPAPAVSLMCFHSLDSALPVTPPVAAGK